MLGINLKTKEGILELYDLFNRGGYLVPHQISLLEDSLGNAWFECKVPKDKFGGPHFNKEQEKWEIPIKINKTFFSWHFLVRGLFEDFELPSFKTSIAGDALEKIYLTNKNEFFDFLDSSRGKEFIEEVCNREKFFSETLTQKVSGMEFCPKKEHNKNPGAIIKGDEFSVSALFNFSYTPFKNLVYIKNLEYNFREAGGRLIIPEYKIRGVVPKYF